jgi:hypothetical protein
MNVKRMLVGAAFMLGIVSMLAIMYSVVLAAQSFMLDYTHYQQENGCIQAYTSQGVARSSIVRDNGECYIKE